MAAEDLQHVVFGDGQKEYMTEVGSGQETELKLGV